MRKHSRVAEWMSKPPIVVAPTISLAQAQQIMQQHNIRRLPVVQDNQLVGIITWGDLREAQPSNATILSMYEWRALLDRVTIAGCMTRNPVTTTPDALVIDAARDMYLRKISGLPVVDGERVVGMITESDLFRLLIEEEIQVEEGTRAQKTRMASL
ncbi:MAG: CBS domain-containing protein [Chloroflexales bacterium]|nr:CBS domain-containing protein [Chloroflexales bacterium]